MIHLVRFGVGALAILVFAGLLYLAARFPLFILFVLSGIIAYLIGNTILL